MKNDYDYETDDYAFASLFDKAEREERAYQQEAIMRLEKRLNDRKGKDIVLYICMGGGKTTIACQLINKLRKKYHKKYKSVLWLAPSWRLLEQAHDELTRTDSYFAWQNVFRFNKDSQNQFLTHLDEAPKRYSSFRVTFTTPQSLYSAIKNTAIPSQPDLIIIDEYQYGFDKDTINEIKKTYQKAKIVGLTGTPPKQDGAVYKICYTQQFRDLVGEYLAVPRHDHISTGFNWQLSDNDLRSKKISLETYAKLNDDERNKKIAEYVKHSLAAKDEKFYPALVFCATQKHCEDLSHKLRSHGIDVDFVHSKRRREDNVNAIDKFKRKEVKVLLNVTMLTQGFDYPEIKTIVLARPADSMILYAQMIGRGMRKHVSKEEGGTHYFNVIDCKDELRDPAYKDLIFDEEKYYAAQGYYSPIKDGVLCKADRSNSRQKRSQSQSSFFKESKLLDVIKSLNRLKYLFPENVEKKRKDIRILDEKIDDSDNLEIDQSQHPYDEQCSKLELPIPSGKTIEIKFQEHRRYRYVLQYQHSNPTDDSIKMDLARITEQLKRRRDEWIKKEPHYWQQFLPDYELVEDGCSVLFYSRCFCGQSSLFPMTETIKVIDEIMKSNHYILNYKEGMRFSLGGYAFEGVEDIKVTIKNILALEKHIHLLTPSTANENEHSGLPMISDILGSINFDEMKNEKCLREVLKEHAYKCGEKNYWNGTSVGLKHMLYGGDKNHSDLQRLFQVKMSHRNVESTKIILWLAIWMNVLTKMPINCDQVCGSGDVDSSVILANLISPDASLDLVDYIKQWIDDNSMK